MHGIVCGRVLTFGSASASLIGIVIIFRLIKYTVDVIIHGFALYTIYDFSVHILGCLWNSVTELLLHLGRERPIRRRRRPRHPEAPEEQGLPLATLRREEPPTEDSKPEPTLNQQSWEGRSEVIQGERLDLYPTLPIEKRSPEANYFYTSPPISPKFQSTSFETPTN